MKVLILGGTQFLGRHMVEAAMSRGHQVTLFNRGRTNPELYPEVERLRGDRDGDLQALTGRRWDAVIDTSGRVPRIVEATARQLTDQVGHYSFISTISVYANMAARDQDETAPVIRLADPTIEEVQSSADYGGMKALCEQVVQQLMPDRALIIRPGLIVGPYDASDRYTYWPERVARGGEVLAPDSPAQQVQYIDARDLAEWTVRMAEEGATGLYNATGPAGMHTFGEMLAACQQVAKRDATFTWVPAEFLLQHDVQPWVGLPLWLPADHSGFLAVRSERAIAAGLRFRAPAVTAADTLAWSATLPPERERRAGLTPEREAAVLQAWHAR